MDYEGICEDLLEMGRKAGFWAAECFGINDQNTANDLLGFALGCQEFRHYLFLNGYGYGGH